MSRRPAGMSGQRFCAVGGWQTTLEAEQGYWSAYDLIGCGYPYVGTTFEGPERVVVSGADHPLDLPEQSRLFVFPGKDNLGGVIEVGHVLLVSAVDEVRTVTGLTPAADTLLDTCGHLRPRLLRGRLVLTVRQDDLTLVPFEQPDPATAYPTG